jgi:thymidylate synthase (FAD)
MGDDLDPVNSAKVSFAKESAEFGEREARLLAFLAREEHTSVFRHSAITYEVYAPLMVARQWFKYIVASSHTEDQQGWNESSRRYVTEEPTFYIPDINEWRQAPENKKQGSGEPLPTWDDPKLFFSYVRSTFNRERELSGFENAPTFGNYWTSELEDYIRKGEALYEMALENGVCAEQARLFLPAYGMYVRWRWTASLGAVMHFLHQRLEHDAQKEIQDFAKAVHEITSQHFPVTMGTLV